VLDRCKAEVICQGRRDRVPNLSADLDLLASEFKAVLEAL
jgi:hypothetical protein